MFIKSGVIFVLAAVVILLTVGLFHAAGSMNKRSKVILFLGDSITAGYGVGRDQAYPSLIQRKIDAQGWNFKVVNAGESGDTTADGLRRVDWLLRQPADVLVLELGGNDGLRGVPVEITRENLQEIIDKVRKKDPDIKLIIAGMLMPPNVGTRYAAAFKTIFKEVATKNKTALIPFLLEGVGGIPRLNQADGIHPTAEGHKLIAANVWKVLEPILKSISKSEERQAS